MNQLYNKKLGKTAIQHLIKICDDTKNNIQVNSNYIYYADIDYLINELKEFKRKIRKFNDFQYWNGKEYIQTFNKGVEQ